MSDWRVIKSEGLWYLIWQHGVIDILRDDFPESVAVSAAIEFMQRFESGDIPDGFEDERNPFELMDWCVKQEAA